MEQNSSRYEDAHSKGSNSEINNNNIVIYEDKYSNGSENFISNQKIKNKNYKMINHKKGERVKKLNENKRYNNMPEVNFAMEKSDNNDNIEMNSQYSSPREYETHFERENEISYCSTCSCKIF